MCTASGVAISRTGQTTELLRAMEAARSVQAPVLLLAGEEHSPAARYGHTLSYDYSCPPRSSSKLEQ